MSALTRPALRWHGGKWLLAPWIIDHFPPHRTYVEPFGGAASVLLRKARSYAEVYNDLDSDLVNLFRVLRSHRAAELVEALRLTPFARAEFSGGYEAAEDEVERARRLVVRSFMGFGSSGGVGRSTGFRGGVTRSGTTPAHDWAGYPMALADIVSRLGGVVVENGDAVSVMQRYDSPQTLHYVDPPYVHATRSRGNPHCAKHKYRHEMSDEDHRGMLAALREMRGFVVLSGYGHDLYDDALGDWLRLERETFADGARSRTEVLWLNQACVYALAQDRMPLFATKGGAA